MKILIVEDDPAQAEMLREPFEGEVRCAASYEDAVAELKRFGPDVVILDAMFPFSSGRTAIAAFMAADFLNAVDQLYDQRPDRRPDIILVSGEEKAAKQVSVVGEWLLSGRISDVLPKGVGWRFFQAVLRVKVERMWQRRQLYTTISDAQGAFAALEAHGIITRDPQMALVWKRLFQAAKSGMHTFIFGESGAGKEPAVRAIAALRNCSLHTQLCAVPAGLFASMIFGTVKGAFPDAQDRPGWIEEAGKNILYLNEFCSTPLECQSQLFQILEPDTREYSRLGENKRRKAECMFIFADNIDPLNAVASDSSKRLIPALANRSAGLLIEIPPLRTRRSDIPLLVDHFLAGANRQNAKSVVLSEEVYEVFQQADWINGNVRQLKSRVEYLVAVLDDGAHGLKEIAANLNDSERSRLKAELGVDLEASRWHSRRPFSLENLDDALIVLRGEMFEPNPNSWLSLGAKPEADDALFNLLCRAIQESSEPWINLVAASLPEAIGANNQCAPAEFVVQWLMQARNLLLERDSKDPATSLHFCAILYLVLAVNHRMDRSDLRRISGRGYTQVTKLEESLMAIFPKTVLRRCNEASKIVLVLGP